MPHRQKTASCTGIVVIGRNEGERLRQCLRSVDANLFCAVYVDSDSADGSSEMARSMGWHVLKLDTSRPLSAARARNEGFECLLGMHPEIEFVQFVDGDTELVDGWMERGRSAFDGRPEVAVVSGRLRELHPQASIYNRLCDLEWSGPSRGDLHGSGISANSSDCDFTISKDLLGAAELVVGLDAQGKQL